ncbi:MAG: hypothetical protein E6J51_10265 [Chloroflexi bacterium]|nr:MAG: hypothetical protein E6J51_10265 [Chloroflexota bacterium]
MQPSALVFRQLSLGRLAQQVVGDPQGARLQDRKRMVHQSCGRRANPSLRPPEELGHICDRQRAGGCDQQCENASGICVEAAETAAKQGGWVDLAGAAACQCFQPERRTLSLEL